MKDHTVIALAGFSAINGTLVKVVAVPREGERILYCGKEYKVADVAHDFYNENNVPTITVFVTPI